MAKSGENMANNANQAVAPTEGAESPPWWEEAGRKEPTEANTPEHRRCWRCWGAHRGVGKAYHTQGRSRYYSCLRCAFTWKALLTPPQVNNEEN